MSRTICKDWSETDPAPGCEKYADLEYTMYFDDIGEPPIYWCENCGKRNQGWLKLINQAYEKRGQEFLEEFAEAIDKAEGTKH